MKNELVSIIMPSYNTSEYICDSIKSVLNQSYENFELIIIDDCSNDDTLKKISLIKDNRIRIIQNQKNLGAALSRNKGIEVAKGKWIAFLDSDDIWYKNKLMHQIEFMKKNNYCFSYTNYREVCDNKNNFVVSGPKRITKFGMHCYCWPGCLTVMYDSEKFGLLQIPNIKKNNDYAMWLFISKKFNCYLLNEELGIYRKGRTNSISTTNYKTLIMFHYKLFKEVMEYSTISSILLTMINIVCAIYKKVFYKKRINVNEIHQENFK